MAELSEEHRRARELLGAYPGRFAPQPSDALNVFTDAVGRALENRDSAIGVVVEMARITYLAAVGLALAEGLEPDEAWTVLFGIVDADLARGDDD
jgi:hypothetical protein